jgi:hypothetical protein
MPGNGILDTRGAALQGPTTAVILSRETQKAARIS